MYQDSINKDKGFGEKVLNFSFYYIHCILLLSFCQKFLYSVNKHFHSDGPFLQKLAQYETSAAPSAGTATRNTYKLTGSDGLTESERKNIVDALCEALEVQWRKM